MRPIVKIGIIGDYDPTRPSHQATNDALHHSAGDLTLPIEISWLPTENLEGSIDSLLSGYDGLFCSPGSPYKSPEGAMNAIRFARENDIPFLGTCGGFQHAVMEYAQNVLKIESTHQEYSPDASNFFITALSCPLPGITKRINLRKGSYVQKIYGQDEIEEKYNCSFGLNPIYQQRFDYSGFRIAGTDENGEVRIFELPQNRFYIATLFQPQLSSTPQKPHKLINKYLAEAQRLRSK